MHSSILLTLYRRERLCRSIEYTVYSPHMVNFQRYITSGKFGVSSNLFYISKYFLLKII